MDNTPNLRINGKEFIKEVAKYFMDFLETDFHKRNNPRRTIKLHNEDNLLIGINLAKYPNFASVLWQTINHGFTEDQFKNLQKGVYRVNIPNNLLELIRLQIDKINKKEINKIITVAEKELKEQSLLNKEDFDQAFTASLENISKSIKTELVLPFLSSIERPLENLNLADENNIYLMEVELTSILTKQIEGKISETLQRLIVKEKVQIREEIQAVFELEEVKATIISFFETFKVTDLFSEVYELVKNQNILDKQDFYLYFYDITFNRVKYPLFYIPFTVEKLTDSLGISFESQVYINKKAIEFIVQEYNNESEKAGNLKSITERIIYLNDDITNFPMRIQGILDEIVNFFDLDSKLNISDPTVKSAKSFTVRISNSCYFALFDKSDEALVNDYEDILQLLSNDDAGILASKFDSIINDFIYNDPVPFNPDIEEEWDNMAVSEKLVARSPIPLNSEQLQLLSALRKEGCNYITVEGPPGTGKSHTITAIAFNAILENKSILVLSDKKEALDVVEDKITQTLNKVRLDKNFQNPLLRLGKTGSTYAQILSSASIDNIKTHHRAVKHEIENIQTDIEKRANSLNEDIQAEIVSYNDIKIDDIYELLQLEETFEKKNALVDLEEVLKNEEFDIALEELKAITTGLKDKIINSPNNTGLDKGDFILPINLENIKNISELDEYITLLKDLEKIKLKLKEIYGQDILKLKELGQIDSEDIEILEGVVKQYEEEKNLVFGYIFKKDQIRKLDIDFKTKFPNSNINEPHKSLNSIKISLEILKTANEFKKSLLSVNVEKFEFIKAISYISSNDIINNLLEEAESIEADVEYIETFVNKYPKTSELLKINNSFNSYYDNKLTCISDFDFEKLLRYLNLTQQLSSYFNKITFSDYVNQKKLIEDLMITQMTYIMDGRLINFYEQNKNTAVTLKKLIKNKQKFPKEEFTKLKEAFPCILAGIRDYAEYIPLEPDIFDLVIIDEASQVSIAQAFPALLRAKKVLILGDKKQFSNVKAAQARSDTNTEYLNNLKTVFTKYISKENSKLVKLNKFNIKTSILEFFEFITNYNIQLIKHFRGYKEIISYSNKYFYQNSLQVMKIRGKNIDEVLKFKIIEHDGKIDLLPKSNSLEIDFIIKELEKIKESKNMPSVGIITPHTQQQKLIIERLNKLQDRDYYFENLNLKVMTFDTCQGEERDIVFYSMVATKEDDRLGYIFISDMGNVNPEDDEGKIKAQRLNVGFSRAKETMHFVLSKAVDDYRGSIGQALMHYKNVLEEAKKERNIEETDKNSPMEKNVMNWFYQTEFWKSNKDNIEFIPQFEIGKYLKQLDKTYNHPAYKVDFLLVYRDERSSEHKIVIEYDGFKEHFIEEEHIDEENFDSYYTDQHIYREKVLESYGYKFLRINRFTIGKNPIVTLNNRIEDLTKKQKRNNPLIENLYSTMESLQNGKMKECPKCGEIRDAVQFADRTLVTGVGKFCNICKHKSISTKTPIYLSDHKLCPKCNSRMILRSGRYGKFYGCSRFPYCRGTIQYN